MARKSALSANATIPATIPTSTLKVPSEIVSERGPRRSTAEKSEAQLQYTHPETIRYCITVTAKEIGGRIERDRTT
jgi:hypothetical protein